MDKRNMSSGVKPHKSTAPAGDNGGDDKKIVVDLRKLPRAGRRKPTAGIVLGFVVLTIFLVGSFLTNKFYGPEEIGTGEAKVKIEQIIKKSEEEGQPVSQNYEVEAHDGYFLIKEKDKDKPNAFTKTYKAKYDEDQTMKDLLGDENFDKLGGAYKFSRPTDYGDILGSVVTIAFLGIGVYLIFMMLRNMQQSGGKFMAFGQSKARLLFGRKTGVTFDDVAGIDEVKEELVEVVDFLKNPRKYRAIGARIPKGVLLVGPPGTGKTLLAKAVAGEAGVPFFHTSGSEFEEMLVGAGASRVRDLFTKAKRATPCIIFIDEIDAVAKKRGTVLHSGQGEQTLNQILVEMDGMETNLNVIVLAATNRPDVLDPAILRPGRFDRTVTVQLPDYDGRLEILNVHAKGKKFAEDVDFDTIARKTIGYSGADLENLLNEAAIMTAKDGRKAISHNDLMEAYLKVRLGRQRATPGREEDEIKRVAIHEAGHAVVAKFTPGAIPVEKVSIISRGQTGGVTVYTPEKDTALKTVTELKARIATGVAGKVAEEMILGEMTTGAGSDIEMVTQVAKQMVQRLGMSEKLGFVKYGDLEETTHLGYQYGGGRDFSEKTAELIDREVKSLIDEAQANAKKIISSHRKEYDKLVELLIENEEVDKEEFEAIFADDVDESSSDVTAED